MFPFTFLAYAALLLQDLRLACHDLLADLQSKRRWSKDHS